MKKALFTLLLVSLLSATYSQSWSNSFAFERCVLNTIVHDNAGFVYSLGYEKDTCLGAYYGSTGLTVYKIQKYNPITGLKIWEKRIKSSTFLRVVNVVFVNNQIHIGVGFKSDICSGSTCINSNGGFDICYITVSTNGIIGMKAEGGPGDEEVGGFEVDENKNIYFTGRATGQITLGTQSYSTSGATDFYLMKKDSSYNEIWTKIGKTVPGFYSAWGMGIKKLNNYLYVYIGEKSIMQSTTDTVGCGGSCNYVDKFDLNGNHIITYKDIVSNPSGWNSLGFADSTNNIYYFSSVGKLRKISPTGTLIWEQSFGYGSGNTNHELNRIYNVIKKNNNYYLSGRGKDPISNAPYQYIIRGNLNDGVEQEYIALKNNYYSNEYTNKYIKEYINGDFLYFGEFSDTLKFDSQTLISLGNYKSFSTILAWNNSTAVKNFHLNSHAITIFPNPSTGIYTLEFNNTTPQIKVCVLDVYGNRFLVKEYQNQKSSTVDLTNYSKGIYFIEITSDKERVVKKIILQ